MNLQIITVPYDSGVKNMRTGRGPIHFIDRGLERTLEKEGHHVQVSAVDVNASFATEIGTTFDIARELADLVRQAVQEGRLPVVLAGNCNSCVGTLAGLGKRRLGIVWFDAHGDFNTPETTVTGFLDGMGLAMAAGRCWKSLLHTIEGFHPVGDDCIVHVGSLDLDPAERHLLHTAKIPVLTADPKNENKLLQDLEGVLHGLRERVDGVYVHLDMDVLDTGPGKPNHLAVPGALPLHVVERAVEAIQTHCQIVACTIASYDPVLDERQSVFNAGIRLIKAVVNI